jgi:hypothetical protein
VSAISTDRGEKSGGSAASTAEAHVQAWLAAWNAHDLDAIMRTYAPDVRFNAQTVTARWGYPDGWLVGRDRLRAHFAAGLRLAPGLRFSRTALTTSPAGYLLRYVRNSGTPVLETVLLDGDGLAELVLVFYDGPQD